MSAACVLPHPVQPGRPRRALDGTLVCEGDLERLRRAIGDLPAQYDALLRAHPGYVLSRRGPAVGGTRPIPLPISDRVAELRHQIEHDLRWWVRRVADERDLVFRPLTVHAAAAWLTSAHLDYAAGQPWIIDMHPVFVELAAEAHAILRHSGIRRINLGECTEDGCTGRLTATIRPDATLELPSTIRCGTCGTETPASRWLDLGHRLRGLWTTAEAVEALGVPRATIHRWHAEGRITPHRDNGRCRWSADELRQLVEWRSAR